MGIIFVSAFKELIIVDECEGQGEGGGVEIKQDLWYENLYDRGTG